MMSPVAWVFVAFMNVTLVLIGIARVGVRGFNVRSILEHKLGKTKSHAEWKAVAAQLDELEGLSEWSQDSKTRRFNAAEVRRRVNQLEDIKLRGDTQGLLTMLQADFHRVTCGITNPLLYSYRSQTKESIERYVTLLTELVNNLPEAKGVSAVEKLNALRMVTRAYGRSALMLNSSVALGGYHLGVIKALFHAGILPDTFFGCNTGAIVAAFICTHDDVESVYDTSMIDFSAFHKRSEKGSVKRKADRFWKEGTLMDVSVLSKFVEDNLGDITFLEAFRQTGRVLNIHVEKELDQQGSRSSWLLNYLTTPHVLVRTAAVASCALRGFYKYVPLLAKTMSGDIVPFDPSPMNFANATINGFHVNQAVERIRELFNINCFIVSDATIRHNPLLRLSQRRGFLPQFAHFFLEEVWRFTAAVSRIPILRSRLTAPLQVVREPIMGDVIINPVTKWADLINLVLKNPDARLLEYCLKRGEQATWPRLAQIRTHLSVEKALHSAIHEIEAGLSGRDLMSSHKSC